MGFMEELELVATNQMAVRLARPDAVLSATSKKRKVSDLSDVAEGSLLCFNKENTANLCEKGTIKSIEFIEYKGMFLLWFFVKFQQFWLLKQDHQWIP